MKPNNINLYTVMLVAVLFLSGCTSSAGGFQQAKSLSLNLTKVANEGASFHEARDKLAKLRLQNLHSLQNSTTRVKQYNIEDLHLWQFSGEALRLALFNSLATATERTQAYRNQLENIRKQQQEQVAKQKSAIDFKNQELQKAAKLFAQLGEKPSKKARLKQYLMFFRATLDKVRAEQEAQTKSLEAISNQPAP
jgi:hypothetical protein